MQRGTHAVTIMDPAAQLGKDDNESFIATLRQVDKPLLEQRLIQLKDREIRELQRQNEIEKDRSTTSKKRERGGYRGLSGIDLSALSDIQGR